MMADFTGWSFGDEFVHRYFAGYSVIAFSRIGVPAKIPQDSTPYVRVDDCGVGNVNESKLAMRQRYQKTVTNVSWLEFYL